MKMKTQFELERNTAVINYSAHYCNTEDELLDRGLSQIIKDKQSIRKYAEREFQEIGFTLFIENESIRGNVLVPVLVPDGVDGNQLIRLIDERFDSGFCI